MKINNQAGMLDCVRTIEQRAFTVDGLEENTQGAVICEHFMDLVVNETLAAKIVCTPSNLVELVLGRLVTEGFVFGEEDVEGIYICEKGSRARVFLKKDISLKPVIEQDPTCCTDNRFLMKTAYQVCFRRLERADWKAEWIFALARAFAEDSKLHRETKGTHGCYLAVDGKIVFSCEDIGRHNAMDKCIGYAALERIDRRNCILFTTGRVPADMVKKTIAAGIPVLVSKAVPTDSAVAMAKEYNLTLICKAWPDRFVVFHESV